MADRISVLYLQGTTMARDPVARHLERAEGFEVHRERRGSAAPDLLESHPIDCIVSRQKLADTTGLAVLQEVQRNDPDRPFVLFPADGTETLASQAIAAGVTEYVQDYRGYRSLVRLSNRVKAVVREVEVRDRRDQRLRRGLRRFEAIFDDPNLLVGLLAPDGTVREVNDRALRYVDADLEDVRGVPLWETPWFDHDPGVQRMMRSCTRRAAGGEYLENDVQISTSGGELRTIQGIFRPIGDDAGTIRSLLLTGQDVTEHERRRREHERRYRAIFDHTYQFTGLLSPDGTLLEANRTALEFGDLEPGDVIGKPFWETYWWQVDDETKLELQAAIERAAQGEFVRYDVEVRGETDTIVIDFSIRPVTNGDGRVEFLIPEGRNITELKTLQERERELERRNERLDEFAAMVSHDLRNPLNVAQGRLELALEDVDSEHLSAVATAHERMEALVEDLLTLSRDGERVDELEPVSLGAAAERCWETVDTTGIDLVLDGDRRLQADPGRLQQLLANLFQNAYRHGGNEVTVGALADGFYVEDNGPGIPEPMRETVFEEGYSTMAHGTGVGLTIVQEIVDAHGWELRLTEGTAGGARFEIAGTDDDPEG